jgi:hypothetical protein
MLRREEIVGNIEEDEWKNIGIVEFGKECLLDKNSAAGKSTKIQSWGHSEERGGDWRWEGKGRGAKQIHRGTNSKD